MDIVIFGTGNTATILSKILKDAGHNIIMIYGRNSLKAIELAASLNTESTDQLSGIPKNADIYMIAVSDSTIEEIVNQVQFPDKIIVHTAASVSKDVLKSASQHYGVFYPLQTLKKEAENIPAIPIIIDANDVETFNTLQKMAYSVSDLVVKANDEERIKLHMVAVFCNNFTNHIYALMEDFCNNEKLGFNLLKPLIKETAYRLDHLSAASAQTGPGIRNDIKTIDKHLALLDQHPHLKDLYLILTQSIQKFNS